MRSASKPRSRARTASTRAASGAPTWSRAASNRKAILAPPGWRNWLYAADLKSAVPKGACGFESRPRHLPQSVAPRPRNPRRHLLVADGVGSRPRGVGSGDRGGRGGLLVLALTPKEGADR